MTASPSARDSATGGWRGDLWGGLTAMLVALPAALAFGVTVFAALGPGYAAAGAVAGVLGAVALGLVAGALGGAPRLISSPCAPAVAVLVAYALQRLPQGVPVATILLELTLIGAGAGALQIGFGLARLGRLIRYMPFPVVSGYLTAVGLIIIGGQLPKLLGSGAGLGASLSSPGSWHGASLVIGTLAALGMVLGPRLTRAVPAPILGLGAGIAAYLALALAGRVPLLSADNPLLIGPLASGAGADGFLSALLARAQALLHVAPADLANLLLPTVTLAGLLSIDTLKTCVVLDAMSDSRHDSDRELIAQGCGNLASALIGGLPGSGTMGATLVNLSSGGNSRRSGMAAGALALLTFALLGGLLAWVPVAALAAILIVVGARMLDRDSLHLLRSPTTMLDFLVIAVVVVVALLQSLIAASFAGIALAALLFVRQQIGGQVIHRLLPGNRHFSKRVRSSVEMALLAREGGQTLLCELQGSLFFGTAHQLTSTLETELANCRFLILDMRRVNSVDVTAAHLLQRLRDRLAARRGALVFAHFASATAAQRHIPRYLEQLGLIGAGSGSEVFAELDSALEWAEDLLIAESALMGDEAAPLELREMELFAGFQPDTLTALEQCFVRRLVTDGEHLFSQGEHGDEMFLIRRGEISIMLRVSDTQTHHLGTYGRGAFFGEMAFLDGSPRSADAVARGDGEVYTLSRAVFDRLAAEHRRVALALMESIARVLATRMRYTLAELRALET